MFGSVRSISVSLRKAHELLVVWKSYAEEGIQYTVVKLVCRCVTPGEDTWYMKGDNSVNLVWIEIQY